MNTRHLRDVKFSEVGIGQKFIYKYDEYVKIQQTTFDLVDWKYTINSVGVELYEGDNVGNIHMFGNLLGDEVIVEIDE